MKKVLNIILFYFVQKSNCATNNVCPTYDDYYTVKDNPNCWYDFTADSNATDIIIKHGYPLEVHKVSTPDGYIVTLFRIPNNARQNNVITRNPVFLQHGLAGTSANFLGKRKESLAFILADSGYDVWIGNFRGTEYSESHVNLTISDKQYWDHSMDEIGLFDIPIQLEYIAKKTDQKGNIIYIGHSLGTTVAFMYASWYPEQAKDTVKLFIMLAPATELPNMPSPFKLLAPFANQILITVNNYNLIRLSSQAQPLRNVIKPLCLESPVLMRSCIESLNIFYGPKSQMEPDTLPVYFNQLPGGTSLKVTRQAADLVLNHFRRYDYGANNLRKYGTIFPPAYDVSKIKVPIFIMYAISDWVCSKKDSLRLYNNLSPKTKIYGLHEVSEPNFNHIDFLFGKNVKTLVYDNILKVLRNITKE